MLARGRRSAALIPGRRVGPVGGELRPAGAKVIACLCDLARRTGRQVERSVGGAATRRGVPRPPLQPLHLAGAPHRTGGRSRAQVPPANWQLGLPCCLVLVAATAASLQRLCAADCVRQTVRGGLCAALTVCIVHCALGGRKDRAGPARLWITIAIRTSVTVTVTITAIKRTEPPEPLSSFAAPPARPIIVARNQ